MQEPPSLPHLLTIPNELLGTIFSFLDLRTFTYLARTNNSLSQFFTNERVWEKQIRARWPIIYQALSHAHWVFGTSKSRKLFSLLSEEKAREEGKVKGGNGEIHATLDGLHKYQMHTEKADLLCFVLRRMCFRELDVTGYNKSTITKEGGIEIIINLLSNNIMEVEIVQNAIAALNNVALDDGNKKKVADAGCIPIVLNAMSKHKCNEKVQEYSCSTLWGLAIFDPNKTLVATSSSNCGKNGLTLILDAIKNHPKCIPLLRDACSALWELSFEGRIAYAIKSLDGINIICKVIEENLSEPAVQEDSVAALRNLVGHFPDENSVRKYLKLLARSMKAHPNVPTVLEECCITIGMFTSWKNLEISSTVIKLIFAALETHPERVRLVQSHLSLISDICRNYRNRIKMIKLNGQQIIFKVFQKLVNKNGDEIDKIYEDGSEILRILEREKSIIVASQEQQILPLISEIENFDYIIKEAVQAKRWNLLNSFLPFLTELVRNDEGIKTKMYQSGIHKFILGLALLSEPRRKLSNALMDILDVLKN